MQGGHGRSVVFPAVAGAVIFAAALVVSGVGVMVVLGALVLLRRWAGAVFGRCLRRLARILHLFALERIDLGRPAGSGRGVVRAGAGCRPNTVVSKLVKVISACRISALIAANPSS